MTRRTKWFATPSRYGTFIHDTLPVCAGARTDLRAGRVTDVIARLSALSTSTPESRESLEKLVHYYTEHQGRMQYDEYRRRGYGIGSGSVESAHKQIVQARMRQAGMRWSELGARHLLALRVLLLNDQWSLTDRLVMKPHAA